MMYHGSRFYTVRSRDVGTFGGRARQASIKIYRSSSGGLAGGGYRGRIAELSPSPFRGPSGAILAGLFRARTAAVLWAGIWYGRVDRSETRAFLRLLRRR